MFRFPDGMHYGRFPRAEGKNTRARNGGPNDNRSPAWLIAGIFLLAVALGADAIWEALAELASGLFDLIQETIEKFFRNSFRLNFHQAQMAAAYADFAMGMMITLLVSRRLYRIWRNSRESGRVWIRNKCHRFLLFWGHRTLIARQWWDTLDWLNKIAVVIGILVMAVPAAMLLSYGLGIAVSEFL